MQLHAKVTQVHGMQKISFIFRVNLFLLISDEKLIQHNICLYDRFLSISDVKPIHISISGVKPIPVNIERKTDSYQYRTWNRFISISDVNPIPVNIERKTDSYQYRTRNRFLSILNAKPTRCSIECKSSICIERTDVDQFCCRHASFAVAFNDMLIALNWNLCSSLYSLLGLRVYIDIVSWLNIYILILYTYSYSIFIKY